MEVVASNSTDQIARASAEAEAVQALGDLVVNLLRIVAGAGKSHELFIQIDAAHDAMARMITLGGDYEAVIRAATEYTDPWDGEWNGAIGLVCRGALRAIAGDIAGQRTQCQLGVGMIFDGILERERAVRPGV